MISIQKSLAYNIKAEKLMKKTGLLLLSCLFSLNSVAQIETDNHSKSSIISQNRNLILDRFLEGNFQKVADIMDYLRNNVEDDNYVALSPYESCLLFYWTKDYSSLKSAIFHYDSAFIVTQNKKIKPQYDYLFQKIHEKTKSNHNMLSDSVLASHLSQEEKDFYILFLNYLLLSEHELYLSQDAVNKDCKEFINYYPVSGFNEFIKKYIILEFERKKWAFGVELFTGYGIVTNELSKAFTNNIPFGFIFDIYYKNFVLYISDYIGFGKTNKDLKFGNYIWKENSQANVIIGGLTLGYCFLNKNNIKIAPFAGINGTFISATDKEKKRMNAEYEDISLSSASLEFGINMDFTLKRKKVPKLEYLPADQYGFLRVRIEYIHPWFDNIYMGDLVNITVGIGGFSSKLKRKY